jgi:hypothetical protein
MDPGPRDAAKKPKKESKKPTKEKPIKPIKIRIERGLFVIKFD